MVAAAMSESRERLTWEQIVEKYPDRWVALTDCNMNGVRVTSAMVCAVCIDKDRLATEKYLLEKDVQFIWRRTTELEGAFVF